MPSEVPVSLIDAVHASASEEFTANVLEARLQQFADESYRLVPQAAAALAEHDLYLFGALVAQSQAGAERALDNQIPATVMLVALARELGAVASSAFGAGFGGSVWAMVRTDEAERFAARWRERFVRSHTGHTARTHFFVTAPSMPAFEVLRDASSVDGDA